jgi:Transposase IS116/IS110/IS902 family
VAAIVLCAWSHPGRCRTDAAFAMLGGAAPIPASSGQTVRVRLNRSGDRQLNQALHLVVLTRLRYDPATRAYATRRRAEGKTNREIRRCLVRYVARQLYRLLEATPRFDPRSERPGRMPAEYGLDRVCSGAPAISRVQGVFKTGGDHDQPGDGR